MANLLAARFCWCLRFLSVLTKTSKPACSAAARSSPLPMRDHPYSKAVSTSWPASSYRSGAGVPWSNRTRTYATASELRAACSSTVRA